MWNFFKRRIKEIKPTISNYHMQFKVVYTLSDGTLRATGLMNVIVPARSENDAHNKLKDFAFKKIDIKVIRCEK